MARRVRRSTRKVVRRRKGLSPSSMSAVKSVVSREISRRAEKKYHLDSETGTNITSAGAVYDLSAVAQGDTDTTRDGDSLYVRSVRVKGFVTNKGGAPSHTRVILFQWFDDSTPTASNVLIAGYLSTALAPVSLYHHDQRKKYNVLYDRLINSDYNGGSEAPLFDTGYKMPKRKKISYTSAATTGNAKLWLLIVNDIGTATYPTISYVSRMTFNDM